MDDVCFKTLGVLLRHESVLFAVEEAQFVFAIEAHQPIGIPVASLHPAVTDVVATTNRETVVRSMLKVKLLDGCHQLVRQSFVGIQTEHPVVLGVFQGQVFLRTVADVGVHEDACAGLLSQRHSVVLAARVGDDDLVAHALQRADAGLDVFGFVQGGDDAGDHACLRFKV